MLDENMNLDEEMITDIDDLESLETSDTKEESE